MARRDLSTLNTVTNVVAEAPNMLAVAAAEAANDYLQTSMKAKVASSYMDMQVDLNNLSKQIEVDYQGDPAMGKQKYMEGFEKLSNQYGKGISSLYGRDWSESVNKLKANQAIQMDNWVAKQSQINTVAYLDKTVKNAYLLAEQTGRDYANSGGEVDAVLKYDSQFEGLKQVMVNNLGAVAGEEKFQEFQKDWVKSAVVGMAEISPQKARQVLDNNLVDKGFSFEDRLGLEKVINKAESMQKKRLEQAELVGWSQQQKNINETYLAAINGEISLLDYYNNESLSETDRLAIEALAFGDEEAQAKLLNDAKVKKGKSFEGIDIFTLRDEMNALVEGFDPEDRDKTFLQATVLKNIASAARVHNQKNRGQGLTKREYEDFLDIYNEALTKVAETGGGFEGDAWFFDTGRDLLYDYIKEQPISGEKKKDFLAYGLSVAKAKGVDLSTTDTTAREAAFNTVKNELIKFRRSDLGAPNDENIKSVLSGNKKEVLEKETEVKDRGVAVPTRAVIKFEDM